MDESPCTNKKLNNTKNVRRREGEEELVEATVRKQIVFTDSDSDSESEVFFNCHAHKRRRTMGDEEMKVWIERQFSTHLTKLATKEQVEGIRSSVAANADGVKRNKEDIADIKSAINRIEDRIRGPVPTNSRSDPSTGQGVQPVAGTYAAAAGRPKRPNEREENAFDVARRSIRIWPIDGKNKEEMMRNVDAFFREALGANPGSDTYGVESIERARSAPRGRAYLETIVTFVDKHARDDIFARGPMLADYRDNEGKPTCGLRLHIPGFLMSTFKVLENFAFHLRKKHNGELTRYIKFDEYDRTLFLQVRHKRESDWVVFSPAQAKEELDKENTSKAQRSRLLSDSGTVPALVLPGPGLTTMVDMGTTNNGSSSTTPLRLRESRLQIGKKNGTQAWKPPARETVSNSTGKFTVPERPAAKRNRPGEDREEEETMA